MRSPASATPAITSAAKIRPLILWQPLGDGEQLHLALTEIRDALVKTAANMQQRKSHTSRDHYPSPEKQNNKQFLRRRFDPYCPSCAKAVRKGALDT